MHSSGVSPFSDLRRAADRLLDWRFHCWYWGDAIAIDGLLEAEALGAGRYRSTVIDTLQRWHDHCLPNFDDVLAPGAAIIRLVMDGDLQNPPSAIPLILEALKQGHDVVYTTSKVRNVSMPCRNLRGPNSSRRRL